jgi:hypothetical protein
MIEETGTQIAYVPTHANGDLSHPDVEFGFVMYRPSNYYDNKCPYAIFCRYWRKGHPGELRTVANSELTPVDNMIKYESVPQSVVIETIARILQDK